MGGDIFQNTLNICVANICGFIVCIITDLSCSNSFWKDDDLSPYNILKHFSRRRLILLFLIQLWNIQIRGQKLNCDIKNEITSFFFLDKLI